jgi:hypothetical protein
MAKLITQSYCENKKKALNAKGLDKHAAIKAGFTSCAL